MNLGESIRTLNREEPLLAFAGWAMLVLVFLMLMVAPWDGREVLGLNPWVKPMKFAISIAFYLGAMGWYLRYLPGLARFKRVVRTIVVGTMVFNMSLIVMQAARGVRSHFNTDSPTDALLFNLMGASVLLNTIVVLFVFFQFLWQEVELPAAYLAGIRLGLAVFFFASLQGVILVLNGGHTVGAPDGGPGLAFLNWSTKGGDLRVAHAVGLHGLQLIPLTGWLVSRCCGGWATGAQIGLVMATGVVYLAGFTWLLREAMAGRPFLTGF